ncbi:hypothetical protein AGDE_12510 [Angomonas deanei]|uniref:Uncharacterized protein n=1 Tax=Angomonas deanei TaxID=59799 RepID=A0A7G2CDI6_9TRYP|nr:hypothetical protein AGDE_12510 [Angomonas deanei]CAD2217007.1 hypothetical protein, conserved [Angomonas deanei]|eukprot:EPY24185.1 hypothetical protein AGDE_12510 [Angomonas deanei]
MLPFQNMSDYTDYFKTSPPLALASVNAHSRECAECHKKGMLGWNITADDYGTRRVLSIKSIFVEKLRRARWWLTRQRDYPLHVCVRFGGKTMLNDIFILEQFSKKLSVHSVEHTFHLDITGTKSLLPFAVLLLRSESICLRECQLKSLQALERLERLRSVEITDCTGDFTIDPLGSCHNLTYLDVAYCEGLTGLETLESLRNLKVVDVRGVNIATIEFLKNCDHLETLYVSKCKNLGH